MSASRIAQAASFDVEAHLSLLHPDPGYMILVDHRVDQEHAGARMLGFRLSSGIDLVGSSFVRIPGSHVVERRLRGIPWNALPILADPRHKLDDKLAGMELPKRLCIRGAISQERTAQTIRVDLATFVRESSGIVSVSRDHPGHRAEGSRAYDLLRTYDCAHKSFHHVVDGEDRTSDVVAGRSASLRFDCSYAINFRILAGRAYKEALRLAGTSILSPRSRWAGDVAADDESGMSAALSARAKELRFAFEFSTVAGDPLFLQAAYAAKAGRLQASFGSRHIDDSVDPWIGSGKHAPVDLGWARTQGVAIELATLGLTEENDGIMHPTTLGTAFLDLLHPDCEDPDVVARWIGRSDEEAALAMDTWIVKFFGKLKNRVDRLPA